MLRNLMLRKEYVFLGKNVNKVYSKGLHEDIWGGYVPCHAVGAPCWRRTRPEMAQNEPNSSILSDARVNIRGTDARVQVPS